MLFQCLFLLFTAQSGFSVTSLAGVFVKYDSYFFNLTGVNERALYGVYILIYCCVGYGICIYKFKIKYCSVILIINKNTLLPYTSYSFECYALLPLFLNVSYQNVNYFCLGESVFIKHMDIKLFFPLLL